MFACEYCEVFKSSFFKENFWWLLVEVTVQNRITNFLAVTFLTYGSVNLKLLGTVTSEIIRRKKNPSSFRKHELSILVFLLAVYANSIFKYMSC